MDDLVRSVERGFDRIDARFESLDSRLQSMEARFDALQRLMIQLFGGTTLAILATLVSVLLTRG